MVMCGVLLGNWIQIGSGSSRYIHCLYWSILVFVIACERLDLYRIHLLSWKLTC